MKNETKKPFPYHMFLVGLFPIISIYSQNVGYVNPIDLVRPVVLITGIIFIFWILMLSLMWNKTQACIMTSLLIILTFLFGPIHSITKTWMIGNFHIGRGLILIILSIVIVLLSAFLLKRSRTRIADLVPKLNHCTGILVVVSLVFTMVNLINNKRMSVPNSETAQWKSGLREITFTTDEKMDSPDIYLILLDMYAGNNTLNEMFGYDNSSFLDQLKKKGFYVVEQSTSNYPRTLSSVPSTLNMAYLHEMLPELPHDTPGLNVIPDLTRDNRVMSILNNRFGYEIRAFASGADFTEMKHLEHYMSPNTVQLTELERGLLDMTPIPQLFKRFDYKRSYRERTLFTLDQLPKVVPSDSPPSFVFAHIMCPHGPYVFNAESSDHNSAIPNDGVPPRNNTYDFDGYRKSQRAYTQQLIYLNKRIIEVVDDILERPNRQSIIIVQSDHGPLSFERLMELDEFENGLPDDKRAIRYKERFFILNAIYFPKGDYEQMYPKLSLVNTFRVVLSQYFGADLELLPDRQYWTEGNALFNYIDATDDVASSYNVKEVFDKYGWGENEQQ